MASTSRGCRRCGHIKPGMIASLSELALRRRGIPEDRLQTTRRTWMIRTRTTTVHSTRVFPSWLRIRTAARSSAWARATGFPGRSARRDKKPPADRRCSARPRRRWPGPAHRIQRSFASGFSRSSVLPGRESSLPWPTGGGTAIRAPLPSYSRFRAMSLSAMNSAACSTAGASAWSARSR